MALKIHTAIFGKCPKCGLSFHSLIVRVFDCIRCGASMKVTG